MELLIQIYIFLIGLIFGSFFNVCILRPFSNETLTKPKTSKCPSCGHLLAWYDNIPLFSYLILKAKCRYCKTPISWQYPFVELITGILFLCAYLKFGLSFQFLGMSIALSYFIIMSATDFKGKIVFDQHIYGFVILGLIYGTLTGIQTGNYINSILGALVGAIILELAARSGYLFAKQRAFGEGDTYIAAGIGAFLGVKAVIISIILSVIIQALWAFPILIIKYFKNKKYSEIISLIVLSMLIVGFYLIENLNVFNQLFFAYIAYIILIFTYAFKVCLEVLNSIDLDGGPIVMPFGPALFMGATILIFFNEKIIEILKQIKWLNSLI